MDPLSILLAHTAPRASMFFAGNLCEASLSDDYPQGGHLHLLKAGSMKLYQDAQEPLLLTAPTLILFPRGHKHKMEPQSAAGCDLVCASISLGQGSQSQIQMALPDVLLLSLEKQPELMPLVTLLFTEAFTQQYGQTPIITRLLEALLILLLRHIVDNGHCQQGILAGLSDPRLARAICAIRERAEEKWTVETLAREAGMSRSRFAAHFQTLTGISPLEYLTQWRMMLACQQLQLGESIAQVALSNGYSGSATFARAFEREFGMPPGRWLKAQAQG
ncbi:MAG: AraC family transcriptional regulator [Vibrionaceae bacterium]